MIRVHSVPGKQYDMVVDETDNAHVKCWGKGVTFEEQAFKQAVSVARMPFVKDVCLMPDSHTGIGATVGSVIVTEGAIMPSVVGVDIGCNMRAVRFRPPNNIINDTDLKHKIRLGIQAAVPHGRTDPRKGADVGSWGSAPDAVREAWFADLADGYDFNVLGRHPALNHPGVINQLGTLGTGNHFIEINVDEEGMLWAVVHSGSRGAGNKIGSYFIERAKATMKKYYIALPNPDLAYLPQGTEDFDDYLKAMKWAQKYANVSTYLMMENVLATISGIVGYEVEPMETVECMHNYLAWENHGGKNVLVSRKGAIQARKGTKGFIPGARGAMSFVVEGLGNVDSYNSGSHGAGRTMSRTAARKMITMEQDEADCAGIECNRSEALLDESKGCYKPIEAVMAAQSDLVRPVHTLRQIINVKGEE